MFSFLFTEGSIGTGEPVACRSNSVTSRLLGLVVKITVKMPTSHIGVPGFPTQTTKLKLLISFLIIWTLGVRSGGSVIGSCHLRGRPELNSWLNLSHLCPRPARHLGHEPEDGTYHSTSFFLCLYLPNI